MSTQVSRKNELLESLSLYEQHCGVHGGASILRQVRELQIRLAESLAKDERDADMDSARASRAA